MMTSYTCQHAGHPACSADLPPAGLPGSYSVEAVLGVPGVSRSAFTELDWNVIAAQGDSLIQVPEPATGITQSWHHGGPDGDQVFTFDFSVNAERRLATARTQLQADGFQTALVSAQDVLESYLSVWSFHLDVPTEAVAWRVTEDATGSVRMAMKHLGPVKPIDLTLTMLSTPELRELISQCRSFTTWHAPCSSARSATKAVVDPTTTMQGWCSRAGPDHRRQVQSGTVPWSGCCRPC
jgi:hypothetical protein